MFSGWMIEWNVYAAIKPNLYFEFLLNGQQSNDELIWSLWQTLMLYLIFIIILLSAITASNAPCFNLFGFIINKLSKQWPGFINMILNTYKWYVLPMLLIWSILIIINPIKHIFVDQEIIPSSYPFKKGNNLRISFLCYNEIMCCIILHHIASYLLSNMDSFIYTL